MIATDLDVVAIARRIAAGELRVRDVVVDMLQRIDTGTARLNAFVEIDHEGALAAADLADRRVAAGESLGALHGVPIAIKDMFDRRDRSPGFGKGRGGHAPGLLPASVVERLEGAGAIIVGTLHMTEYALGLSGHNDHLGHARNPWSAAHVTGGSSSGPAAAVAARLVPAAIGSDTGASVRIPAAWCGVPGIKPTHGRVSRAGAMPMSFALDCIGPIATSVRGLARVLTVIAGADPRDPSTLPVARKDFEQGADGSIAGLRIGIVDEYFGDRLDPGVGDALEAAKSILAARGATLVPALPGRSDLARRLHRLCMLAEAAALHAAALQRDPTRFTAEVRYRLDLGGRIPAAHYLAALRARGRILREFVGEAFASCDLLFTALVPRPAPELARTAYGAPAFDPALLADVPKRTQPFNFLGLPALAVPCGFVDRRPVAFQLVGRPFDEATLLRVGMNYEQATPWHAMVPPGFETAV
jgi:aspartyl-tRNA(Asn)/glutamyl-tRNA(Gln) amidotransferase subunit A